MPETMLIRCPQCGTTNRVPQQKLQADVQPVCGRCKALLPVGNQIVTATDADFADQIERSPVPVLVDMWAPWCGPCRMIAPAVEQLASDFAGRLRVAKLNVDENPVTSERFNIRGIPALVIIKQGREVDRIVGVQPKAEIIRRLQQVLA
jgi:thioredoxin 2